MNNKISQINNYELLGSALVLVIISYVIKTQLLWSRVASMSIPWLLSVISIAVIITALYNFSQLNIFRRILLNIAITLAGLFAIAVDADFKFNAIIVDALECLGLGVSLMVFSILLNSKIKSAQQADAPEPLTRPGDP